MGQLLLKGKSFEAFEIQIQIKRLQKSIKYSINTNTPAFDPNPGLLANVGK